MGGPRRSSDQIAIDHGFRHGHLGEGAACSRHLRRDRRIATALSPFQNARCRQNLRSMADRGEWLLHGVEVADHLQHPGIQTDVFRSAAAGDDQSVVVLRTGGFESGVEGEVVATLFGIGLIAFKIMNRCADGVAGFFAGADDVDGMTDHEQGLKWHHDFVIFDVIANEHENVFAGHRMPPERTHRIAKKRGILLRARAELAARLPSQLKASGRQTLPEKRNPKRPTCNFDPWGTRGRSGAKERDGFYCVAAACAVLALVLSSMVSMSVRILSHSRRVRPRAAKKRRMVTESQRRTSSRTGTRTLMALSLRTVRRATRVMNLASETAMVRPSYWLTCIITGKSELPSPM